MQLFSNPAAGSHSARRVRALAAAFEAGGASVILSESAGSPPVIAPNATHVCVAAGDGTVRHVAGAVARGGHAVTMSIFPAGTVNLLAMEAGYPRRPDRFARAVLASETRRDHYPVMLGDSFFFACAGVGPDSAAVANVSADLKRRIGRLAYAVAFCALLRDWPRHRIVLEAGGGVVDCEAFYVAKGRYYAGRLSFAREARVHHPLLHVVALTTARRRDYARFLLALVRGGDAAGLPGVRVFSCTELSARCDRSLSLQADGDIVGSLPVTMRIADKPLSFR